MSVGLQLFTALCEAGNALEALRDLYLPESDEWLWHTEILGMLDVAVDMLAESSGLGEKTMIPDPAKKPPGRVTSLRVTLTPEERRTLESWQRSPTIRIGLARRARVILLMAQGWPLSRIARVIPMNRRFVHKWTARWLVHGFEGLYDLPRPGTKGHGERRAHTERGPDGLRGN